MSTASKYQVWELVEICGNQLGENFNEETALETYKVAVKHNAEGLQEIALKHICRYE